MKDSLLPGNTLFPQGRALKLRSGGQTSVEVIFYSVQRLYRGRVSLIRPADQPVIPHEDPGGVGLVAVEEGHPDVPRVHLVIEDVGEDRVERALADPLAELAGELLDVGAGRHLGEEALADDVLLFPPGELGLRLVEAQDLALAVQPDGTEG